MSLAALVLAAQMALPPAGVPGSENPTVTQSTIHATICVKGWTARVRPPADATMPLKMSLLPAGRKPWEYELDHLIPLELGGALLATDNLWLEPIAEARVKDELENRLRALVCTGRLPLADARQCIATDWVQCARRYP